MRALIKLSVILFVLFTIVSCSLQDQDLLKEELNSEDGTIIATADATQVIKDRFIVVFKDGITNPAATASLLGSKFGLQVGHIYENVFRGFSASIPEQALNGLKNHPLIAFIEPDITMYASAQMIPTGIKRIAATSNINNDNSQSDVDIAIIDTGVDKEHPDLNVVSGVRFYLGFLTDSKYDDDNGHGSHVGGIVAARDNDIGVVGIVPGARLYAVKVLNSRGSGYLSDIIKGLDWVRARASTIDVINMSLGGTGTSASYHTAISNCVIAGIVVVVAAGNESTDVFGKDGIYGTSDDYIPASYPEAAAISAMADSDGAAGGSGPSTSYGADDSFATFSNFSGSSVTEPYVISPGRAIDLVLPGVSIYSTYKDLGYATMSGTSMASPHGAGLAALYIIEHGKPADADGVYIVRQALINAGKAQTSPEGFAVWNDPDGNMENIGWAGTGTNPGNLPPVAVFSYTTNGLTVTFTDLSTDDGSITAWNWTFGDEGTSTLQNPSHTYTSAGTYNVSLTVKDNYGSTNSTTLIVSVTAGTDGIILASTTTLLKNRLKVDLTWSPALTADVYREGTIIATGVTGYYTDQLRVKGTYTYLVKSREKASNEVSVTY